MKPGRNDPCPCGSGKKYKACCMERDRASGMAPALPPHARAAAAAAPLWQADVVPMHTGFRDEPDAMPVAVMVEAGGYVPFMAVRTRVSPEAEPLAGELEAAVAAAATAVGAFPERVQVRHAEVAAALAPRLAPRDVRVEAAPRLEALEAIAGELLRSVAGTGLGPISSAAPSWAAWGLPREDVAELFHAAAVFHRAAPWRFLTNAQALHASLPDGRAWTLCVLGNGGEEYGLSLYSDPADFRWMMGGDFDRVLRELQGRVVTLLFESAAEAPPRVRREAASAGWELAAPDALPYLITMNTPAGGITRRDASELRRLLRAVAAFTDRFGPDLARGEGVRWVDPATGISLTHDVFILVGDWDDDLPGLFDEPLWPPVRRLEPGAARGRGAEPEAALEERDPDRLLDEAMDVVAGFEGYLADGVRLGDATVNKHADNAAVFVHFLSTVHRVPLRAVHEVDLRAFLFDWIPRFGWLARYRVEALPASLRHFFAFLEAERRIACPWAGDVLDRKILLTRYDTCPGSDPDDPDVADWMDVLHRDLAARSLVPEAVSSNGFFWFEAGDPLLDELFAELWRRWLLWREELVASGIPDPVVVRERLRDRQAEWENSLQPRLGGRTPAAALEAERRQRR